MIFLKKITSIFILLFVQGALICYGQTTRFVDINASGAFDGTSWTNAFNNLNTAVTASNPGDTILIKQGVYKHKVSISRNISIYGGFNGMETLSTQSNPQLYPTIFDADINGDDIPGQTINKTDNLAYLFHVGSAENISAFGELHVNIGGITFKNAHNAGTSESNPAINSKRGSAVIVTMGGSIFADYLVTEMYCNVSNCMFLNNISENMGGALYVGSTVHGGAAYGSIDKCYFSDNQSLIERGAAIFNYAFGGEEAISELTVTNSIFEKNQDNIGSYPAVIYSASSSGGGQTRSRVYNSTFYGNTDESAVFIWNGSSTAGTISGLDFQNNIVWNNNEPCVSIGTPSAALNAYSIIIKNNCTDVLWENVTSTSETASGNFTTDPLFVNAGSSNYTIQSGSPCIDAGDTTGIKIYYPTNSDYSGFDRFVNNVNDVGALEFGATMNVQILQQPVSVTACNKSSEIFSITALFADNLAWEESTNGGSSWSPLTNGGIYSGVTTGTLTLNPVSPSMDGNLYRCQVNSGIFSDVVSLTVFSVYTAVIQTGLTLSSDQSGATSYQWIDCSADTIIPGATDQTFTPDSDGNYAVIITNLGCTDTSSCTLISGVGLEDQNAQPVIQLYPNPTSQFVSVELTKSASIEIYSATGILIEKRSESAKHILDVTAFADGIYFIKAEDQVVKFIKQ